MSCRRALIRRAGLSTAAGCWGTYPTRPPGATRTSPLTRAPAGYSPSSASPVVVLPLPEAPTSAVTLPGSTRRLTAVDDRPAADLDAQVA